MVDFIEVAVYVEWISNVVPIVKKNGKTKICIDFRNLILAFANDEYPMLVTDMLVDSLTYNEMTMFIDGNASYN